MSFPVIIGIFFAIYIMNSIKILSEYERGVIFRLGRILSKPKGPGIILVFAPIDRIVKVDLRTIAMDVPPQDVITKDNVSIKVNAVVYYKVIDPTRAIIEVEDFHFATSQMSQTSLRSTLGQVSLDELLSEREKINSELQLIVDKATDPWGIKVSHVEIKHVDLPQEMQRAIARQAEAERERRAKIISAEGEFQASAKLAQAAEILQKQPMSLQMRYLQTLMDISSEKSSIIVFPLPMEMLAWFKKQGEQ
jgi:regulator of protease activity HflC (stomatin/prohibitin superfamily)